MAEPTTPSATPAQVSRTPALPSTADAVPYVPVSWMAAAAMTVAGLFVLIILILGADAFYRKKPLIIPELLLLPAVALILSFAARRIIRNAEGTRTGVLFGVDLTNTAWWISVVLGLGYAAYLMAIEFSIRQDAKGEVQRWVGYILKDDVTRAFYRTRDPNERANTRADDTAALEARYRSEFIAFRHCDLVRVATRNQGQCEFAPGGLRDWAYRPNGVECVYTGTLSCPEGTFPVHLPLRAVESGVAGEGGGRQWQVVFAAKAGSFVQREQVRITPYGWFVQDLEQQAGTIGRTFILTCGDHAVRSLAYGAAAEPNDDPLLRPLTPSGSFAQTAFAGGPAFFGWAMSPKVFDRVARRLYKLPPGGNQSDEQKNLAEFVSAWNNVGIVLAGSRLRDTTDVNDSLTFTDKAIEVRVPVEIPLTSQKQDMLAARGRVVVECTDPEALATAKQLREAAKPEQGTIARPDSNRTRNYLWRVRAIESDMKPISTRPPGAPGGPPEPGMGGPEG